MKINLVLLLITTFLFAENSPSFKTQLMSDGFSQPLLVRFHPETNAMFVVEQTGKIKLIEKNKTTTFIDLSESVMTGPIPDERGLLGMALHPNFVTNGLFYVSYVDKDNFSVVASYFYDNKKQKVNLMSERKLFHFEQPYGNHNGGHLEFSPKDNYLYLGFGDGGSSGDPQNNAQDLSNFLGKILRIDINTESGYKIPDSNPYKNEEDKLDEIWAYGLRNPWRFSFDKFNGDLYIGDVGQYLWEEINKISSNESDINFGWKIMEGNHCYETEVCNQDGLTKPIFEYPSDASYAFSLMNINQKNVYGCSVTGGYVYRGNKINDLSGLYLFSDFCTGKIWSLNPLKGVTNDLTPQLLGNKKSMISSFGEDIYGELYIVEFSGSIYKIVPLNE